MGNKVRTYRQSLGGTFFCFIKCHTRERLRVLASLGSFVTMLGKSDKVER